ncbi:MAG TPA: FAD-dependent oxidoreductase, partial [Thermoanaerobaculia bacterium]|nr:FAD-dependent oxidoreductase [Thermoanaerobaculia bacterium]
GLAAAPLAARYGNGPSFSESPPRVAVIGAGAFGGWAALHLRELGAEVILIDAWGPGNARSSSGGKTRVIRAIYGPDRIYSEMVKRAFELWEMIDGSGSEPLYVETGALWMHRGDDGYLRSSLPILEDLGFPVEKLTLEAASRRYPQIDFRGVESVWLEKKAGALRAQRACVAVRDAFEKAGGSYRTARVAPGPVRNGSLSSLSLEDGSKIEADLYLFACGPWLGQIFPEVIGERVRPTRQEVYYFTTPRGSRRYHAGHLPVWIDFGERIVYGIPEIDADGQTLKVADDTRGEPIDPTTDQRIPSQEGIDRARRFLAERFPELAQAPLHAGLVCQYENSPDGNLILDRHPEATNVWIAGGGSGHGFKLAPVVGEMMAGTLLAGNRIPPAFLLERLRDPARATTQFERDNGPARD